MYCNVGVPAPHTSFQVNAKHNATADFVTDGTVLAVERIAKQRLSFSSAKPWILWVRVALSIK
jgi:hypothetical protein